MTTVIQLWTKNRPIAYGIARDFYIPGADQEDVRQEALIGLWMASRDYKPELGPFGPFARMVINRRLVACVRAARRQKHIALNTALRSIINENGDREAIADVLPHLHQVADVAEDRERLALVMTAIRTELTDFERHCVLGIASGVDYLDLGPYKKVDNALFRARNKLRIACATES